VSERARYIGRIRKMSRACAEAYLKSRYEGEFPLIRGEAEKERWLAAYAPRFAPESKESAPEGAPAGRAS
jgi:hypothetical protein